MIRHTLSSFACAAAAALPAQPYVTIAGQLRTLDVLVLGTAVGTPVLLVGYVSVIDNTTAGEPAYGALATAAFSPYLDDVWLDGSEYLELANQGLAESVQLLGSGFRIPYWVLEKTMRDYDAIRLQGGPVGELTQARQAGATALHWSPAPAGWSESFPRPIPWSLTQSGYAPPPSLDLELAVRAMVAHQFGNEPSAGPSGAIGLFHANVEQVVKAIHSEWGEYTMHLQALVLDPPTVPGGPPIVRITPTSSHGVSLPDDPGGPGVLRLVQGPSDPFRYVGMNGVPFAIELRQPVAGPVQMANLGIVFPAGGGSSITVSEISTGVGSTWLQCVLPPDSVSGTVTVVDRRSANVPLPLAQPHDGSPVGWVDFTKFEAPGGF